MTLRKVLLLLVILVTACGPGGGAEGTDTADVPLADALGEDVPEALDVGDAVALDLPAVPDVPAPPPDVPSPPDLPPPVDLLPDLPGLPDTRDVAVDAPAPLDVPLPPDVAVDVAGLPDVAPDVWLGQDALPELPAPEDVSPLPDLVADVPAPVDLVASPDLAPDVPCRPSCDDLECGDDGCGGSCGRCPDGTACDDDGQCARDGATFGPSRIAHAMDGAYTGLAEGAPEVEWSDLPAFPSRFGQVFVDYDGAWLHLLVDVRTPDGTLDADDPRRKLRLVIHAGPEAWTVVAGRDVALLRDGLPATDEGFCIATVGASPDEPALRRLVELRIPAGPGALGLQLASLADGAALVPDDGVLVGMLHAGGGLTVVRETALASAVGAVPPRPVAGGLVELVGIGFGEVPGTCVVGGRAAEVLAWSDTTLLARVAPGASGAGAVVRTARGERAPLAAVRPAPRWDDAGGLAVLGAATVTVDGAFTGFEPGAPHVGEWAGAVPVRGQRSEVAVTFDGLRLAFLVAFDGPLGPDGVALVGWSDEGRAVVEVRADESGVRLLRNGRACICGVDARLGAGPVPWARGATHLVLEVTVDVHPGAFAWQVTGPDAAGVSAPDALVTGTAWAGGGVLLVPAQAPTLVGLAPAAGSAGTVVVLEGALLDSAGTLVFTPDAVADTTSWSGSRIDATVPVGAVSGFVAAERAGRSSTPLWFVVPGSDGDGDGLADDADLCPGFLDLATADRDGDGLGDACDPDANGDGIADELAPDDDGDGSPDGEDNCPALANPDQADADHDHLGDACDDDRDGDGVPNASDLFPDDPEEVADRDGDGVGDNGDAFPDDPQESSDRDGDGVGDNGDAFPDDPAEVSDRDGDGVGDNGDAFPDDPQEISDRDGDGVGDNGDAFPDDPLEVSDRDGDGVGDNGDAFPDDPLEVSDRDGDGVGDNGDCRPDDPATAAPDCTGRACGDDGCGGSCGGCPGRQVCADGACGFVYTESPRSTYAHTVDGAFTDWQAETPPAAYEWYDALPARGVYTNAYFDYDGVSLYILNDWFLNDARALDDGCYNLFVAYTGGGAERWQVKVYAEGRVDVYRNGLAVELEGAEGAYGFGPSPLVATPHTIYELKLPAAPGGFALQLHDPGPSSGCDVLVGEPTTFVGELPPDRGPRHVTVLDVPWIAGANPAAGGPGTLVEVRGVALGAAAGSATLGGQAARVVGWSDGVVTLLVPEGADASGLELLTIDGWRTNRLAFDVPAEGEEPGAVLNPRSRYPHTVDGAFTDFGPEAAAHEWQDVVPAAGRYTYAYFDYDGERLHILNDWHLNDVAAIDPGCYNRFVAWTGGGSEQWELRVYGSGVVEARRNGVLVDATAEGVEGKAGFGSSPLVAAPHTIFELSLPAAPGGFGVQLHDPGPSFACLDDMWTEPSNFQGTLDPPGGGAVVPSPRATLFALDPPRGMAGDTVRLLGAGLDRAPLAGVVFAPSAVEPALAATIVSASATELVVTVPAGVETGLVRAIFEDGRRTNGLRFAHIDADRDGVADDADNCPAVANPAQSDLDDDGAGDDCDADIDGDGAENALDCRPLDAAFFPGATEACDGVDQDCDGAADDGFLDTNADGEADCVDSDDDGDGDPDGADCAPLDASRGHTVTEQCFNGVDDDCDGAQDEACAGQSCLTLHQQQPTLPSGVYAIDPDGAGPLVAFEAWCDMESDGGGWTYGAIVRTTTSSQSRTRLPGVTVFGSAGATKLANEYSVNLTGVPFSEVRIDNFTLGRRVLRSLPAATTWDATTYASSSSFPAKRFALAGGWEFRTGYYTSYCGLETTNIPICFCLAGNPTGWVCDTDSGAVEGWVDPTGGEICGQYYCKKVWRDTACTSYVSATAVYGVAVR